MSESINDEEINEKLRVMGRNGRSSAALALLGMMGVIGGDGMAHIPERQERPRLEADPKWNGKDKIPVTECFLSVGPGELEDRWYPCLMAMKAFLPEGIQVLDENGEFAVLARMKYSFDTAEEALDHASRTMTSVAVLGPDGKFSYPHYKERMSFEIEAENKRRRRADRLQVRDWQRQGLYDFKNRDNEGPHTKAPCVECQGVLQHQIGCPNER